MEQAESRAQGVSPPPSDRGLSSQNPQAQMRDENRQRKISYGVCGDTAVPIRFMRLERLAEVLSVSTGLTNVKKTGLGGPTQDGGVPVGATVAKYTE
jgi:hypothetical protein